MIEFTTNFYQQFTDSYEKMSAQTFLEINFNFFYSVFVDMLANNVDNTKVLVYGLVNYTYTETNNHNYLLFINYH